MNKNLSKYSNALFKISKSNNELSKINNELKSIIHMYKKIASFRFLICTKTLTSKDKSTILKNTLLDFDPLVVEFIVLVIQDGYSKQLINIIKHYNKLSNSSLNTNNIDLIIADDLDEQFIEKISNSLLDIVANPKINIVKKPEIIGGIKLKIGNKVFDNSISTQLTKLKKTLFNT